MAQATSKTVDKIHYDFLCVVIILSFLSLAEAAGDDTSTASNERTPRRTARRQTSKHTASTTTSVSATSSLTQSSSTSAAAATACDAGPPSKRAKRVIDDTVTEEVRD